MASIIMVKVKKNDDDDDVNVNVNNWVTISPIVKSKKTKVHLLYS